MIRNIGNNNELIKTLIEYTNRSSIYACRIACLLESYGTNYDFASFYLQLDDSGKATAAAAKYYSDITIMASDFCDSDELAYFVEMNAPSSVLCPNGLASELPERYRQQRYVVMKRCLSETGNSFPHTDTTGLTLRSDAPLKEIWELISSCKKDGLNAPAYEDFLLDASHKLRHGTATLAALYSGGKCAGAAMTTAESRCCAVIGAVAVSDGFRRQGVGSACVEALCGRLSEKGINDVYILREADRNEKFYCSLNFHTVPDP